jgi:hypothetical protein
MKLRSERLSSALAAMWQVMGDDYGLMAELPYDAVMARARRDEAVLASPRLVELLVDGALPIDDGARITDLLGRTDWSPGRRVTLEEALDAWWEETLSLDVGEHRLPYTPDVVLGLLIGYGAPMVRWLDPWIDALDGPGSGHLARMVVDGLDGPAWVDKADEAGQVLGWARTETVVNGLALVGAAQVDDELLGRALDRLID